MPRDLTWLSAKSVDWLWQAALIGATIAVSWWGMQIVHELGHVLHAWWSGGRGITVWLHPLEISRTDVAVNPHAQFVAWGGPLWGVLIPAAGLVVACAVHWSRAWLVQFFAGFCLIANGAYLGAGAFFPVGDAETLLHEGAWRAALVLFGLATIPSGLACWNGLGRHFGLGAAPAAIDRRATATLLVVAAVLVAGEFWWSAGRST